MILRGDCIERMAEMDPDSIDAIVCDPPYGLEFMGKEWDRLAGDGGHPGRRSGALDAVNAGNSRQGGRQRAGVDYQKRQARDARAMQDWHHAWATEALRILKPGGHLLAFGGTRTYHRLACAVEDAGFEIRDSLIWLYGSGFPKSLDVSKAIDKAAGAEREVVGKNPNHREAPEIEARWNDAVLSPDITAPATPEAQAWQGWGTALKPAHEPIVVARKPLAGTVAQNVLGFGTGALNIDGCRVEGQPRTTHADGHRSTGSGDGWGMEPYEADVPSGRWPPNVLLSHLPGCEQVGTRRVKTGTAGGPARGFQTEYVGGDYQRPGLDDATFADPDGTETIPAYNCAPGCPVAELDRQSGERPSSSPSGEYGRGQNERPDNAAFPTSSVPNHPPYGDTGGASRFFYVAKSSRAERTAGVGANAHPT